LVKVDKDSLGSLLGNDEDEEVSAKTLPLMLVVTRWAPDLMSEDRAAAVTDMAYKTSKVCWGQFCGGKKR